MIAAALPLVIPVLVEMGVMGAGVAALVLAALAFMRWYKILKSAVS